MKQLGIIVFATLLPACTEWETDVDRGGFAFSKYRTDETTGVHIGMLAEDATAQGYACAADEWAHFRSDWSLEACMLAAPYALGATRLAAGTWVMPREDHLVVAFAEDTACQGNICRGTGGMKGVQAVFNSQGRLIEFFPATDTEIDDVVCRASLVDIVQLHPNGRLKRCTAAADGSVGGIVFKAGQKVSFTADGRPEW